MNAATDAACRDSVVSIPFRADTGFEQPQTALDSPAAFLVSIPFRADTGFELAGYTYLTRNTCMFQSLSGLTLGLNLVVTLDAAMDAEKVSIPFRADTGFERYGCPAHNTLTTSFNPFQG